VLGDPAVAESALCQQDYVTILQQLEHLAAILLCSNRPRENFL
jgi:hypothetical protein